jgi:hypothetical protein
MLDLVKFCEQNATHCDMPTINKNLQNNYLVLVGVLSSLGSVVKGVDWKSSDAFYKIANEVGIDAAKVVTMLLGYKPGKTHFLEDELIFEEAQDDISKFLN